MNLSEKIFYCRKKAGLSQEALAEQIGVSRQSVSKWETGEADPEISKLKLLADTFHVTIDWLLSEDAPSESAGPSFQQSERTTDSVYYTSSSQASSNSGSNSDWVDKLPGTLGKLVKRFGWLFGVYVALIGGGFTLVGGLAKIMSDFMATSFNETTNSMLDSFYNAPGFNSFGGSIYDEFGTQVDQMSSFVANNPVSVFGTVLLILGILLIIAGTVLAVILKKKSNE